MRQIALRFGANQEMLGILARPDRSERFAGLALVVWNTGIAHHIGPHRVNVELAEAMTRMGLAVFRFDLSGRGDSQARQGQGYSIVADVREAMNTLEEMGFRAFILHGLCSGAVESHYAAHADPRVVGLSMVDTYAYRVGSYYRHYLAKRVFKLGLWVHMARRAKKDAGVLQAGDQFFVPFPPLERIRSDFRDFQRRGLKCHVVYSGGYDYVFNHPQQFQAMLPGIDVSSLVELCHFPNADHLFTLLEHRQKLIEALTFWVQRQFSSFIMSPETDPTAADTPTE